MPSLTLTALTSILALLSMANAGGITINTHPGVELHWENGSGQYLNGGNHVNWFSTGDTTTWTVKNGLNTYPHCSVDTSRGFPKDSTVDFWFSVGANYLWPCDWQEIPGQPGEFIRIVCEGPEATCT